ncbi:putative peptidase C78, ubiquitin modifier-specific peptidase 1/ 2 [Septoria linicola]|nr:putative peptidase C78, ubiquitin modifier-specific peptidase 1/ 2 [Septoria linicola]
MTAERQVACRLGKRELGRHAYEDQMPSRIAAIIDQEDDRNKLHGAILKLALLLQEDRDVVSAYLCTASIVQVCKLKNEGGHFCGYRNIQMLWSSMQRYPVRHSSPVSEEVPPISAVQAMIETAWDKGFNAHGRLATGGIKGTRKHVGTSEVEALMLSLDIACIGHAFSGKNAWLALLDFVEKYFVRSSKTSGSDSVTQSELPPLFLQRPGHSMTIVGFEKDIKGRRRLLVFDPAWSPPSVVRPSSGQVGTSSNWSRHWALKMYRKDERYLKRHQAFELLELDGADPTKNGSLGG